MALKTDSMAEDQGNKVQDLMGSHVKDLGLDDRSMG